MRMGDKLPLRLYILSHRGNLQWGAREARSLLPSLLPKYFFAVTLEKLPRALSAALSHVMCVFYDEVSFGSSQRVRAFIS